jgi:F-type H+-transporting ATPase subunit epsilon
MEEKQRTNSNDKIFELIIQTPSGTFFSGKTKSVTIPSVIGTFQVLFNHAPVLAAIASGTVIAIDENNKNHEFFIENGIAEVSQNVVKIAVSVAEIIADLELSNLEKLVEEANQALAQQSIQEAAKDRTNKRIKLIQQKIKAVEKSKNS